MKIKSIIAAALVALLAATSAFAQGKSKSLVVYFSRANENYGVGTISEGNTAILAKMIASKNGSEIFEIVPEKAYPKNYRECTNVAKDEQRKNARPAYKGDIDTSGYDTIYIGYPIWWGDLPMVCYTFLEKHDLSGKTIVPFCTHEGSGLSGTDGNIKRLYKNITMKTALVMRGATAQNQRKDAEKQIDEWLKKLGVK
ncbi:MAG: flavodoxin [Treponema sp.]|nr:flavodoxin [Treponema sp.]